MNKPFNKDAIKIAIYGATGSGKSFAVKQCLNSAFFNRVVVFDPTGEYAFERGFTGVKSLRNILKEMQAGWGSGFKIAYNPMQDITQGVFESRIHALSELSRLLMQVQSKYCDFASEDKIQLLVDELATSFPNGIPRKFDGFQYLCSEGRHFGIDIVGTTQRPAVVNTSWRGNITYSIFCRVAEPLDAEYGSSLVARADRADIERQLLDMPDRHYIKIQNGKAQPMVKNTVAIIK